MKKIISLILTILIALTLTSCEFSIGDLYVPSAKDYEIYSDAKLIVHFIDVGQGDSILLESNDEFVLIDAGEKEYGDDVAQYIKNRGAKRLSYVIATHPHSDHIGGMAKVLDKIPADNFITAETDQSTRVWINTLKAVDKHDINYIDAKAGDTYSFGESEFTILAPLSTGYDNYNNYSVVTKAVCEDISFLLTGDAEKESEYEMLSSGENLRADVLKCGHHGSSTSTTGRFLSAVSPAFAVISCSKDNEYGHPHKETLEKLDSAGIQYYRTDESGTITAITDGHGLKFFSPDSNDLLTTDGYQQATTAPTAAQTESEGFIGNKNSLLFHKPSCSGAKTMKEKNKVYFDTRDEAVDAGYSPCSLCEP